MTPDQRIERFKNGLISASKAVSSTLLAFDVDYIHSAVKCAETLKNGKKGILLMGGTGTGKTHLMHCLKHMAHGYPSVFTIENSRQIARDYKQYGESVIDRYGKNSYCKGQHGQILHSKPIHLCIDDIGFEEANTKMYGNNTNVIAEILADREEGLKYHGMITHATTNLDPTELKKAYGDRVYSRIEKMFDFVVLKGEDRRRVKK